MQTLGQESKKQKWKEERKRLTCVRPMERMIDADDDLHEKKEWGSNKSKLKKTCDGSTQRQQPPNKTGSKKKGASEQKGRENAD